MERKGDNIFIPSQESYEITNFIDGSILTISDAPWPGFTPDLLSIVLDNIKSQDFFYLYKL